MIKLCSFVTVGLLLSAPAIAQVETDDGCDGKRTEVEQFACASEVYIDVDAELNAVYKKLRERFEDYDANTPDDAVSVPKTLLEAQRAWIKYRDNNCEMIAALYKGGLLPSMMKKVCLSQMTRNRIVELQRIAIEH